MRLALVLLLAACAPLRGRGSDAIRLLAKPGTEPGTVRFLKTNIVSDYALENRRYAEEEMRDACGGRPFKVDHEWEEDGDFGERWQVVKFRCGER